MLELTYTAWDLEPFAADCGYHGPPFLWDEDRRFVLRAELDAAFFHLYGLGRDEAAYILNTFAVLSGRERRIHGGFRTGQAVLSFYDAFALAAARRPVFRTPVVTGTPTRV